MNWRCIAKYDLAAYCEFSLAGCGSFTYMLCVLHDFDSRVDACLRNGQKVPQGRMRLLSWWHGNTTSAAKTSSLTSLSPASYSLSSSSSKANTSTSSAAQGASSTSTFTSGPASSSNGGGGLDTSDKVALGIGMPGTFAAIVGAYYTYKSYRKRSAKSKQHP